MLFVAIAIISILYPPIIPLILIGPIVSLLLYLLVLLSIIYIVKILSYIIVLFRRYYLSFNSHTIFNAYKLKMSSNTTIPTSEQVSRTHNPQITTSRRNITHTYINDQNSDSEYDHVSGSNDIASNSIHSSDNGGLSQEDMASIIAAMDGEYETPFNIARQLQSEYGIARRNTMQRRGNLPIPIPNLDPLLDSGHQLEEPSITYSNPNEYDIFQESDDINNNNTSYSNDTNQIESMLHELSEYRNPYAIADEFSHLDATRNIFQTDRFQQVMGRIIRDTGNIETITDRDIETTINDIYQNASFQDIINTIHDETYRNQIASIDDTLTDEYGFEDIVIPLPEPIDHYGELRSIPAAATPSVSNGSQSNDVVCRICCPVEPDEIIEDIRAESWYHLLCGHDICVSCADSWFQRSKKCPFCRSDLHEILTTRRDAALLSTSR